MPIWLSLPLGTRSQSARIDKEDQIKQMKRGAVIVDWQWKKGGNVELSQPD